MSDLIYYKHCKSGSLLKDKLQELNLEETQRKDDANKE